MKKKVLMMMLVMCFVLGGQSVHATPIPKTNGEGIILIEPKTNTVLFGKNENKRFYPASITKILTGYIVLQQMSHQVTITKTAESVARVPSDSSHIGLQVGEQYGFMEGLYGLLLGSDNFIAYDMAQRCSGSIKGFSQQMNQTATALGAKSSNFVNPHGYHDPNHYTTPYDMAQIARGVFADQILRKIAGTSHHSLQRVGNKAPIKVKNSAKIIQSDSPYYNPNVVAVKTGYHSKAAQTIVAMAEYPDITLIAVVMKTNSPNQYKDLNALFEYGAKNYRVNQDENGSYSLINQTASTWAKPYVVKAEQKKWLSNASVNYTLPISKGEVRELLQNALPLEQLTRVSPYLESIGTQGGLTRKAFGELIKPLSQVESHKLMTYDQERAISYEEVICIVFRLII